MALHYIKKRCPDCRNVYAVRKPNRSLLIPKIIALIQCPRCHPEAWLDVCAACGVPWSIVKRHSNEQCNTCVLRRLRYACATFNHAGRSCYQQHGFKRYKQAAVATVRA